MGKWIYACLLCSGYLISEAPSDSYLTSLEKLKRSNGKYELGEIEILVDPKQIQEVCGIQKANLLRKGFSSEFAERFTKIGIIEEDQYFLWVRDAVYFPNKKAGTYDRIIWKNELLGKACGVAVLPVFESGRILLNLNYRHATRSWELELPRGTVAANESLEEAAVRELKEETGVKVSKLSFLGNMAPDSGILSAIIPVYLGRIVSLGSSHPEESEAIAAAVTFSKDEILKGIVDGHMEVFLNGEKQKVPLRDSFVSFALLQAILRKAI